MNEAAVAAWAGELRVSLPPDRVAGAAGQLTGHVESEIARNPELLEGVEPALHFAPGWVQ